MLKLILLSTVQSLFLVASQIFLKFAGTRMGTFHFTVESFKQVLLNWQLACSGISIAIATALWMYILKHFEFSVAYPMISISYVFGMIASVYIFNESVPMTRWIGVGFIMIGVIFIAR